MVCLAEDAATFRATLLLRRILPEHKPFTPTTSDVGMRTARTLMTEHWRLGKTCRRRCGPPPPLPFTAAELEHLAALEHQRWEAERRQDGWRTGPTRDPVRRLSPYLVPWENLPEEIKDLDRDAIRALPTFLTRAGFAITRRHTSTPH